MTSKEPALTVGVLSSFVAAVLLAAAAWGLDISKQKQDALLNLIPPAFVFITTVSLVIRQFVFSPNTVKQEAADAYAEGVTDTGGSLPASVKRHNGF